MDPHQALFHPHIHRSTVSSFHRSLSLSRRFTRPVTIKGAAPCRLDQGRDSSSTSSPPLNTAHSLAQIVHPRTVQHDSQGCLPCECIARHDFSTWRWRPSRRAKYVPILCPAHVKYWLTLSSYSSQHGPWNTGELFSRGHGILPDFAERPPQSTCRSSTCRSFSRSINGPWFSCCVTRALEQLCVTVSVTASFRKRIAISQA